MAPGLRGSAHPAAHPSVHRSRLSRTSMAAVCAMLVILGSVEGGAAAALGEVESDAQIAHPYPQRLPRRLHSVSAAQQGALSRQLLQSDTCPDAPEGYYLKPGFHTRPSSHIGDCQMDVDVSQLAEQCNQDCNCRAFDWRSADSSGCLSNVRGSAANLSTLPADQVFDGIACWYAATNLTAREDRCGPACPEITGFTLYQGYTQLYPYSTRRNDTFGLGWPAESIEAEAAACLSDCACKAFMEGGYRFTHRGNDWETKNGAFRFKLPEPADMCYYEADIQRDYTADFLDSLINPDGCPDGQGVIVAAEDCTAECDCDHFTELPCENDERKNPDFCAYQRDETTKPKPADCPPPSSDGPPPSDTPSALPA